MTIENHVSNVRLLPQDMPDVLHLVLDIRDSGPRHWNNQPFDVADPVGYTDVGTRSIDSSLGELCSSHSRPVNIFLVSHSLTCINQYMAVFEISSRVCRSGRKIAKKGGFAQDLRPI